MTPWLATSYKWSDNAKVLTWTIRKGVMWSNGQPMTAADVAFTFNLIKQNPSLDLNAIRPPAHERDPVRQRPGRDAL